ncbi:hypothetical protein ACET3X_000070 [Alternaria dauci]|uniref:HTH myb-type domain-containing protein n=1 Tax=Alternaria dauci TaxID=48095 RepID=A0ABR3UTD2_9PLEO
MDDRRSVRSASRRKSPTPQPPSKTTAPQRLGRAARARSLRSASREVEDFIDIQKPARRSARQASVTTNDDNDDDGNEPQKARKTKRKPAKELLGDLTVVEEMDTQIDLEQDKEAPGTPTRTETEPEHASFQSPGAASQMSGTTAISSFSMVEAEFLEPRFILKHLRKLCDSAEEFLEHVAPDNGTMEDDMQNIREMQKPGSAYSEDYLDLNDELNVHLKHFKSEEQNYIHIRALHRALFKTNEDGPASQSGLDLILYLANLLVLAKQMIYSNRDDKNIWDVLRQLDNTFPAQFMQTLDYGFQPTAAGESALYQETFDLALELRTQLVILVLQKSVESPEFDIVETLKEIFFIPSSSDGDWPIRGWNLPVLGGDDSPLPEELDHLVQDRVHEIHEFFREGSSIAELDELKSTFPWEPTILRLLDWVRLRRRELQAVIDDLGGPTAIARNVKQAVEGPQPVVVKDRRESLYKKRASIGRGRRRSSRKFNPTAPVDMNDIHKMESKQGDSGVYLEPTASEHDQREGLIQQPVQGVQVREPEVEDERQDDHGSMTEPDTDTEQDREETSEAFEKVQDEQPERNEQGDGTEWETLVGSPEKQPEEEHPDKHLEEKQVDCQSTVKDVEEHQIEEFEEPQPSAPPQSPASLLKALKDLQKSQKENRPVSIFDRQTTAQRIEFGNGFDDIQSSAGPSNTAKGKQPAEPSSRKRRYFNISDSDSDAFEPEDRSTHAPGRRRAMPWAKKQRTQGPPEPTSSGAPPSHQPPPHSTQPPTRPSHVHEPASEPFHSSMTESELPPSSTWPDQRKLAKENRVYESMQPPGSGLNARHTRRAWSEDEEMALVEYMAKYGGKYSKILQYDEEVGGRILEGRTQVNLKDKMRNMALQMIRSGAGLRRGFENIVHPGEKHGRALVAAGWEMHPDGSWEKVR